MPNAYSNPTFNNSTPFDEGLIPTASKCGDGDPYRSACLGKRDLP
jgi:hypothetical protein